MGDLFTLPRLGAEVIVTSKRSKRPWRAKLLRVGPTRIENADRVCAEHVDDDQCVVLPIESGRGWSTQPLIVSKEYVAYLDGSKVR